MASEFSTYTRDNRRHRISGVQGAFLEFEYPRDSGERWRFAVADISWGGLSFHLTQELAGLAPGCRLAGVVLQIGDVVVRGELRVIHVTDEGEAVTMCGASLHPAGTFEEAKLHALLESLSEGRTRFYFGAPAS